MLKAIELYPDLSELRGELFDQLAGLTPEQLDWTPAGSKNAISWYLRHLGQSEDFFLNAWILGRQVQPKRRAELPDFASMRAYLEATRANTIAYLESIDVTELIDRRVGYIEGFRGRPRDFVTVGWLINRVLQHETYHLGQIQLLLRLQGARPADLF